MEVTKFYNICTFKNKYRIFKALVNGDYKKYSQFTMKIFTLSTKI